MQSHSLILTVILVTTVKVEVVVMVVVDAGAVFVDLIVVTFVWQL